MTVPAVIMDLVHEMPIVWSYLFGSLLLFVSLTANMENKQNYWDFSVDIVLGFRFTMNWLHIHNLRTAGYSKHIVICKLL